MRYKGSSFPLKSNSLHIYLLLPCSTLLCHLTCLQLYTNKRHRMGLISQTCAVEFSTLFFEFSTLFFEFPTLIFKFPTLFFKFPGPCKVRNETETKQIETKRNKSKRNETDRNETKRNGSKRNKTKRNISKRNETNYMASHCGKNRYFLILEILFL